MTSCENASSDQETKEYCQSVVNEVEALEQLLASGEPFGGDLDDELHELWVELAAEAGEDPAQYTPSVFEYINLNCLEFIILGERSSAWDEWNVIGVRLLRTYGGPYATIEWHETCYVVVEVNWGRESSTAQVFAPNLTAALAELATE
jgi:hypothetical protein